MAPGPNLKSGSGFGANQNQFGRVRTPRQPPSVSTYITSISLLLLQVPDSYWLIVLSEEFAVREARRSVFPSPMLAISAGGSNLYIYKLGHISLQSMFNYPV
ncbi:hypothetical protein C8R48DRAFT_772673 [Suillus tomentosus]|nr:hypothetical protein C8R48DRAFT_772673 [Suillus tomentosus]